MPLLFAPTCALRSSESSIAITFPKLGTLTCGALGTDAFLCQLGQSIAAALRAVPETAEASRAHLRSMRATLHAAIDARCDDLEAGAVEGRVFKGCLR